MLDAMPNKYSSKTLTIRFAFVVVVVNDDNDDDNGDELDLEVLLMPGNYSN